MQIYYCDACGLRVNNSELVPAGDKVFCHACAQKQSLVTSPPRRTPSGGVVLPQRPKTDGFAIPTPVRGNAATQRPPSPSTGSNFGSGQSHTVHPSTGTHRATSGNERPRTGHTAAVPRPTSSSTRATNAKNAEKSTVIYAGAGAGAMLLVVVIVFAMRGNPAPATPPEAKKDPAKTVEIANTKTTTPPVVAPPPEPKKVQPEMDDIRERIARREFDAAMKAVREAGPDVFGSRRPLEDFIRRYRSTQAGQEALAFIEKQAKLNGRAPDTPSKTDPGLKVELYERPNDWEELRGRDLRSLKKYKDMTLDRVDMGSTQNVMDAFSPRREYIGAVITGFLEVPADGEYNLTLSSDDASILLVGDWKVVDNDGSHAVSERGDSVPLKKGKHRIRINYSQGNGEAALQFFWSGTGIGKQIVPPSALSHE